MASNTHDSFLQVASELNAALLRAEHAECTQPRLASLLKLLLWSQNELDKKGISYQRMTNLATGETENVTRGLQPRRTQ